MAVVATGFFDGVHLGHRKVIETLVSSARERGEEAIVVTFAQHPRLVLGQDAEALRMLTTQEEKTALLKGLGVDRVEVVNFTKEFASLTAYEYLREVVKARFGATAIVLGYDTRIGSDRQTVEGIRSLATALGLEVICCEAVGGISSTKIRKALAEGRIADAEHMLGHKIQSTI